MNGCAIVYIPGLTGSISGSVTVGSATSAAKRVPSGDQTGSLADRVNDSRQGAAAPLSMAIVIRCPGEPAALAQLARGCWTGAVDGQHERIVLLLADHADGGGIG